MAVGLLAKRTFNSATILFSYRHLDSPTTLHGWPFWIPYFYSRFVSKLLMLPEGLFARHIHYSGDSPKCFLRDSPKCFLRDMFFVLGNKFLIKSTFVRKPPNLVTRKVRKPVLACVNSDVTVRLTNLSTKLDRDETPLKTGENNFLNCPNK